MDIKTGKKILNDDLIAVIQGHPYIYDKSMDKYKTHDKTQTWKEIAHVAGFPDGKGAQIRWNSLRDQYTRERKKRPKSGDGAEGWESQWPHFTAMKFMDKHLEERKNRANTLDDAFKGDIEDGEVEEDPFEDFQFVGENRKRPNTGYATPKSAKKGRNDDFEDRILKAIEQESAETSFGKMVGQSLASLSIRSRAIAKLKIQEVLTYAALESIDVLPPPPRPPSM